MITSPYESTATRNTKLDPVITGIKQAEIDDELMVVEPLERDKKIRTIYSVKPGSDIPLFIHPINIGDKEPKTVINLSLFSKYNREGELVVTTPGDYRMGVLYGILSDIWFENPNALKSLTKYPKDIFVDWITSGIVNRFKLDLDGQIRLKIVVSFYWYSLFTKEISLLDKSNIIRVITQDTYINSEFFIPIMDDLRYISDIEDLVTNIKEIVGDVRLEPLNSGLLFSLLNRGWWGLNSIEITSVALEYPPAFLAMLTTVLSDRGYKKTVIGRLAERHDKKGISKQFMKSIFSNVLV